jgi:hypothetical protein
MNSFDIIQIILRMFSKSNFLTNGLPSERNVNLLFALNKSRSVDFRIFYIENNSVKKRVKIIIIYLFIYVFKLNSCLITNFDSKISFVFNKYLLRKQLGVILKRGKLMSTDLNVHLYLNFNVENFEIFKVGGYIPHKDEADILEHSVKNLTTQEIVVTLLDDNSDDTNNNLIKNSQILSNLKIISLFDYGYYNWTYILDEIDRISSASNFDFILRNDADEYLVSPIDNYSLRQFLFFVNLCSFEKVDSVVCNLHSTSEVLNDFSEATHFSFPKSQSYKRVLRAWKNQHKLVNLSALGGHDLPVPSGDYFPLSLTLLHAPMRNSNQIRAKLKSRNTRGQKEHVEKGWHDHLIGKSEFGIMKLPDNSMSFTLESFDETQIKRKLKIGLDFNEENNK